MGTTKAPPTPVPVPEVTVQPNEPESEPEPGAFPDTLLAGLKKSGHLAVPSTRLQLQGPLARQIRDRIAEHRIYPEAAVDLGLEGRTITRFRLDARGRILDFEVLNPDAVDPLLVEGARRSIEAGAPYPVPEATVDGSLYLAVACWADGQGTVKRLRMIESTGRDGVDSVARDRARDLCAKKPLGWHVVEFEHGFRVVIHAQGDRFGPSLVEDSLPAPWAKAVRAELADLFPPLASTAAIRIPITFKLTW
ncbi:MAG: energy transducer TonB [Pseudomonadota bacterium]